jgi:hypothetical protein
VSVPIVVKPEVFTGETQTYCCGKPKIFPVFDGKCDGHSKDFCTFIVSQNFCVEVPIKLSAQAFAKDPRIICEKCYDHKKD